MLEGRRIHIRGTVQGVGFRPWVCRRARELGVRGSVWNDGAGVVIDAFSTAEVLERFVSILGAQPPPAARVEELGWAAIHPEHLPSFEISASDEGSDRRVSIPPDLPTCLECLAELRDPGSRRYRYPFTNCTNCGPRYTIVRALPYDRPATTMASFPLCAQCEREYRTVEDRRFHAEPIACPGCGPRLFLLGPDGARDPDPDPLRTACCALRDEKVVAIKGLGGFHLAVDATSSVAVGLLRSRKRREEKPFAVMVPDLASAEVLALLEPAERALLTGIERPIVLVRLREGILAPAVAPGLSQVGLMLPYTPLHHLLLEEVGRPLVMTSGNLSDEPICTSNEEAVRCLGPVADLILAHDREIAARADDSVARVIAGKPQTFRRSRGYVSRGVRVSPRFAQPVLACGGNLKNTFCLGVGDSAYLSAHFGDLENLENLAAFEAGVERMERLLQIRPEVIAHDLHPGYLTTRYAHSRTGVLRVAVQHHHAHVVSAMTEHGLSDTVLGVAFDGTGLGTDGQSWGGELLLARRDGFDRVATLRAIALPGGDRAMREIWRTALSVLEDAFDGCPPLDQLRLFDQVSAEQVRVVRQMRLSGLNSPSAHGAGRYFDALAALVLARPTAAYEGQVAMALEQASDRQERGRYPFECVFGVAPWELDLRPMVRAVVGDLIAGKPSGQIAARFHNTLVSGTSALVREASRRHGRLPIVLTGGCFNNAQLTEGMLRELPGELAVYRHGEIPAGDGGLALGQAVVAAAVAKQAA